MIDFSLFDNVHSWNIECNDHRSCYDKIIDYVESPHLEGCLTDQEKSRCIETDNIAEIRIYPFTPISFYIFAAPTLKECYSKALKMLLEQNCSAKS